MRVGVPLDGCTIQYNVRLEEALRHIWKRKNEISEFCVISREFYNQREGEIDLISWLAMGV